MTTGSPRWWHDPDELYTVLRDLLQHLRRRASTFDERTEGWLLLSGMHLDAGPWRYLREVDVVDELPFETGLVLVNEMLARLQELRWDQGARGTIGQVHHRLDEIWNPHELEWLRPPGRPTTTEE